MKAYVFPLSPNARKVMAVAAHLDLPLDYQVVDLTKGETRTPEFLKLNPNGKMPVLVDGDFVLWESNAIMQYLASQKPNGLWPDDARVRADICRWQCWQLSEWMPACGPLLWENLLKAMLQQGSPDAKAVQNAEANFLRTASILDQHLAQRDYLVGDDVTLADLAMAAPLEYAAAARMPWASHEHLQRWYARIDALPAWQKTKPRMG